MTENSVISGENHALVVGGSNGIGLAIALTLSECGKVTIIDRVYPDVLLPSNINFISFDLQFDDYSVFDSFTDVNKLVITAGIGRLSLFEELSEEELVRTMQINSIEDFYCTVMGSIAGFMSSPFFSVYGASKAALKIFIESLNVELLKGGFTNQILNVSPGSLKGTNFAGRKNDLSLTRPFAEEIINRMMKKEDLFIPKYEEIFKEVLFRYNNDFRAEGAYSYDYKLKSGRVV